MRHMRHMRHMTTILRALPARLMTAALVAALLVVGGFALLAHGQGTGTGGTGANAASAPTSCAGQSSGASIQASYAHAAPSDLHGLKAASDLIVEVSVTAFVRYETTSPGGYSVYSARVVRAMGGKHAAGVAVGSTIQVRQVGGRNGCVTYVADGDPLMQPGERDFLFLTTDLGDPVYNILFDTAGRFQVDSQGHVSQKGPFHITIPANAVGSDAAFARAVAAS